MSDTPEPVEPCCCPLPTEFTIQVLDIPADEEIPCPVGTPVEISVGGVSIRTIFRGDREFQIITPLTKEQLKALRAVHSSRE